MTHVIRATHHEVAGFISVVQQKLFVYSLQNAAQDAHLNPQHVAFCMRFGLVNYNAVMVSSGSGWLVQ
jgi:hypothetical protein